MSFMLARAASRCLMVGLAASVMAGCSGRDVFKEINDYTNRQKAEMGARNDEAAARQYWRSYAIADMTIRTEADLEQDNRRHTFDTMRFASMNKGQRVAELMMGSGYFTRVLSAVVGPEGHVTAWQPAQFIGFGQEYASSADAADALANVDVIRSPITAPELPTGLDLVFTAQNYHDMHLAAFPTDTAQRVNAAVFRSLKPGGYYVIIDHDALPGSGLAGVQHMHRIDVATVIEEVTAAGFVLEEQNDVLSRAADPRTTDVFDPAIRGMTSQFMLRFRKPG